MKIATLLLRWAEAEPLRIKAIRDPEGNPDGTFRVILEKSDSWVVNAAALYIFPPHLLRESADHHPAILQFALQQAIVAHNLIAHLDNAGSRLWWAKIVTPESVHQGCHEHGAISLLAAYVDWLEHQELEHQESGK